MATIKTDLICNLNQPVNVTYLHGNLFSQDNAGNTINVFVMDNGEPATIGGTVSANVIRSDGQTVAVSGAIEGNKAYVILPQACYAVPGVVHIIIKLTQSTTITTIAAIVANVYMSTTDAVIDPGTVIPSIQALMALIEEAVDSIPTDYTGLLHTIAADYSSSKTYKVGDYAWESGVLKRCIVPITAAETYTAAHWTNAVIGDDLTNLKSALDKLYNGETNHISMVTSTTYPLGYRAGNYNSSTGKSSSSGTSTIRAYGALPILPGDKVKVSPSEGHTAKVSVFSTDTPNVANNADNPSFIRTITGSEIIFTAVEGEYYFVCTDVPYNDMSETNIPTVIYYSGLLDEVEGLEEGVDQIEKRVNNFICSRTIDAWTYGTINVSNGVVAEKTTPQPYIHTPPSEAAGITKIAIESGYAFMLAAYAKSDGTYIGVWKTNSFEKSATWQTAELDVESISNIKTYNVIVIVKKADDTNLSLPTDAERTTFYYRTDTTFTVPGVAADSVAVGNMRSLAGKTIVSMGDSIFGKYSAPSDISSYLSSLTGAKCYNCAFGGTRAVVRTGAVDTKYFDFGSLVSAILANDFTTQEAKAEAIDETYPVRLETLESVDWNTVDILTISYGTNDYNAGYAIADFKTALVNGIEALMTAYPNLRVALCSPIFRVMGESGSRVPADEYEINGQTLTDFVTAVQEVSVQEHTQFINNYYLGVNMFNWEIYYNDTTHPKAVCRRMIATNIWNNIA